MERNAFLNLCREVSMLPEGLNYMRTNVPLHLRVIYNNSEYYPVSLYFKFLNGRTNNIAVLHDLKANSFLSVPLEEVRCVPV